ncbi:DoxX-like family protein [Robertkochia solimangrovi]|uniref:DoxX-like family protein n=1 Tax=Robertkochia solimangrovi TaxID=2213046 RepID=UPI0011814671|nr:DoxX-like family protein [Robertkochia solimangrovi]TRZ45093.1 hypothetical protein DMZ48_04900 [Robertkochia solimangrovi]
METKYLYIILNLITAFVWLINGLFCKVLNLVPRHREIVNRIIGAEHAEIYTILIGFSEIIMAIWIFSGFRSKWNSVTQMIIVAIMNIIEFIMVPELLLWGRLNSFFAILFIALIYYKEFILSKRLKYLNA